MKKLSVLLGIIAVSIGTVVVAITLLTRRVHSISIIGGADGHIKFYNKDEWIDICGRHRLAIKNSFDSSMRFPKMKDTAYGYEEVLKKHDKAVIDSYNLVETKTELYLTEQVNNILFEKN